MPLHAQDTTREVRERAFRFLAEGDFMGAIPDLQLLIERYGDSQQKHIIASMENVYFNLGISHFFIGQFEDAEKGLKEYLKRYPKGFHAKKSAVYIGDALRFRGKFDNARGAYEEAVRKHTYRRDMRSDIHMGIARCFLAEDKWHDAIEPLTRAYFASPDFIRKNWAATMLTTAYLKELALDKIYPLVPYLLRPNSLASRSIPYNLAALQAGDELFAEDQYRDALWVYRMVYSHDLILVRTEEYLEYLRERAERIKQTPGDPRRLMRLQENIGELELQLEALEGVENYDLELYYRIGRSYMQVRRFWEGREVFLYLHDISVDRQSEEALYLAFQCSAQILPWVRAFEIGETYMEKYPGGEFFDSLTLTMGHLYARQKNWPEVIRHLTKTLEMSPEHQSGAECMLLLGYASFMEEKFKDAVTWLRKLNSKYPQNELRDEATYWTGMALLFDSNYEEAAVEFDRVLQNFPNCIFVESSAFRRAVCDYGMSLFEAADERLATFLRVYPESIMAGEGLMMRGDIGGALGNLDDAAKYYRLAMKHENLNIEYYNHCAFQTGQIFNDTENWTALRSHFKEYMEVNREDSNLPLAIYWIGVSLWNSGEQEGALRFYRQAVAKYGKDHREVGIDMILDEWIGRTKRSDSEQSAGAWSEFREALRDAKKEDNPALMLRFKRALLFHPEISDRERQQVIDEMLLEENLPIASPAVLQAMLDYAKEGKRDDFAVKVAEHMIATFTETDYALDARMVLAEYAIRMARESSNKQQAERHYADAIKHLGVVREVFASSGEAGKALMLLGTLYREKNDLPGADECYKSVLGVKGWRQLWPEALYGRGECAYLQRDYDVASAYYERIYLMYGHYTDWVAKAYLRRADCLKRTYREAKAREVLNEMLKDDTLAARPEAEEAREMLRRMGGQI